MVTGRGTGANGFVCRDWPSCLGKNGILSGSLGTLEHVGLSREMVVPRERSILDANRLQGPAYCNLRRARFASWALVVEGCAGAWFEGSDARARKPYLGSLTRYRPSGMTTWRACARGGSRNAQVDVFGACSVAPLVLDYPGTTMGNGRAIVSVCGVLRFRGTEIGSCGCLRFGWVGGKAWQPPGHGGVKSVLSVFMEGQAKRRRVLVWFCRDPSVLVRVRSPRNRRADRTAGP